MRKVSFFARKHHGVNTALLYSDISISMSQVVHFITSELQYMLCGA